MLAQMRERLIRCSTFERAIWAVLDDTIALHGAECGTVQLISGDELVIVAQRHLTPDFLNRFHRMRADAGTAYARALACGASVVVRDVEIGREFGSFRRLLRSARVRAVQSTPLRTKDGDSLGVLSTHFVNVHEPTKIEMETLQAYAKEASQYALKLLGETPLATMAAQMSEELYHSIELTASPVRYARSAASSQRQGKPFPGQQRALAR
jgi:GAF domain-containing protein